MCSSVLSLNYDSRKQQMISIFSFVTVWTNWNRTQNSICVVLSPGTTSRLLSSFFSYVWLIKPSPWPTTHQAGEPEKVPLHRQRCSLCVLVGFGDGDQICFFHVVITRGASSHTGKKKSDWIVKPWEHVDQNIQISEVVKVFARKTINNKRDEKVSHRSLENWKFDPRPKSDVFSLFMHDSWFSCRHSFVATFAATFSTERVICSELQSKSRRPFLPQIWRWCPSSLAFSC